MKNYEVKLQSKSAIAFSRYYVQEFPKLPKETSEDHEKRTWINRAHVTNGKVVIPALAFKNALTAAARFSGEQIPGKGKRTYTQRFASGLLVVEDAIIADEKEIKGMWLHVPSDGMRGGSKRVMKCFPTIAKWDAKVNVIVLDDIITKEVLEKTLIEAGNFIGLGALRVQNNGVLGRFSVEAVKEVKEDKGASL